ncbi:MAG: anthranilate synthase component I [Clostridiales bacterium]|nr:anthranilate synthase component I [Clostridiales bacterium]
MLKQQVFDLCQGFGKVPVYRKIYADFYTPVLLLKKIAANSQNYYLFESVKEKRWSRYSFLGLDPSIQVEISDNKLYLKQDGQIQVFDNPIVTLKTLLNKYTSPRIPGLPVFTGGAVGYFGFESAGYFDNSIVFDYPKMDDLPDIKLMFIDNLIVFDHYEQYLYLIANMDASRDREKEYQRCQQILDKLEEIIKAPIDYNYAASGKKPRFETSITQERYIQNIKKAQEYIKLGEVFQVVPSVRFFARYKGGLFEVYRKLRTINPSPYLYYIKMDELEIAGCSPETLIHIENGQVITYPIAGTRPRGRTEQEDRDLEQELLNDPKEIAEHNMLVDLSRNDLGKISEIGSVEVRNHLAVERYSHVMHLTSVVAGRLKKDCNFLDALGAVLPAGTLSGAPKIRAMQIIGELEPHRRGIYGGAICYLGYNGNMDCCIAIRTVVKYKDKINVQSGAGVVLDSDPLKEYQETLNKAQAVLAAVEQSC